MSDILIKNGMVVDGTGEPRYRADIAIEGDRIINIGLVEDAEADITIDASGYIVTPGFVDMHSHSDFSLPVLPTADSYVHQGITTVVIGQCGSSPAPLLERTRKLVLERTAVPLPWDEWSTFGSYLDYYERNGTSVNIVHLVGQGTIRSAVMGFSSEPATETQMSRMKDEVIKAMDHGAIGVSTGLIYPPGSYAGTEELITLIRPVGERDGFYFSHIRGEGETLFEAISEAIRIGRETDTAVQISHFKASGKSNWDKSAKALELIDNAHADGLDVSMDMYPYIAGSTGLISMLPEWAQEGGKEAILKRLSDTETRKKMADEMQTSTFFSDAEWDKVMIIGTPGKPEYEGRYIAELAAAAGKSPYDWVFDTLFELELNPRIILFMMSEENRRDELCHPLMMIGTDGYALAAHGPASEMATHPRSYGTYPEVLGHYVRDLWVITLEEAIWKMCGFPAKKLRWTDRGLAKKGFKADLVIFDPDTVASLATYEEPHRYPEGIPHVIINGKLVIHETKHTQKRPGMLIGR